MAAAAARKKSKAKERLREEEGPVDCAVNIASMATASARQKEERFESPNIVAIRAASMSRKKENQSSASDNGNGSSADKQTLMICKRAKVPPEKGSKNKRAERKFEDSNPNAMSMPCKGAVSPTPSEGQKIEDERESDRRAALMSMPSGQEPPAPVEEMAQAARMKERTKKKGSADEDIAAMAVAAAWKKQQ